MTKSKLVKLIVLVLLLISFVFLATFILSENKQQPVYKIEGEYKLIENTEDTNLAYVYKLTYKDTSINIVTTSLIDKEELNSGWRGDEISTFSTKNQFNSSNLLIYENSLVYFEDGKSIYINNLSEGTAKKLDITDEHPQIVSIAQEDNRLILLINNEQESNQRVELIERAVDIETMEYKDSLISFELSEKLPESLINNLTGSNTSNQIEVKEKSISGRALDVWEFSTDFAEDPIVYSASNGDYIVSDIKMNELGVITFNGNYTTAFKEMPEYWIIGN